MNLETALQQLETHYHHAKARHPETKPYLTWQRLITARLMDLADAYNDTEQADAKLVAGKRAFELAAMSLRMVDDLNLGFCGPTYDSGALAHTVI